MQPRVPPTLSSQPVSKDPFTIGNNNNELTLCELTRDKNSNHGSAPIASPHTTTHQRRVPSWLTPGELAISEHPTGELAPGELAFDRQPMGEFASDEVTTDE